MTQCRLTVQSLSEKESTALKCDWDTALPCGSCDCIAGVEAELTNILTRTIFAYLLAVELGLNSKLEDVLV